MTESIKNYEGKKRHITPLVACINSHQVKNMKTKSRKLREMVDRIRNTEKKDRDLQREERIKAYTLHHPSNNRESAFQRKP